MERIAVKSIGTLIDELITTSNKIYHLVDEEKIYEDQNDYEKAGHCSVQIHKLNRRRGQLVRAIDERLGEGDISMTAKTTEAK